MQHTGIVAGLMRGDGGFLLQNDDRTIGVVGGQVPRGGQSDNSAADDQYVAMLGRIVQCVFWGCAKRLLAGKRDPIDVVRRILHHGQPDLSKRSLQGAFCGDGSEFRGKGR